MNRLLLPILAAAALCAGLAHADEKTTVYKSKGASGETVYTQLEVKDSQRHQVGINEPDEAPAEAQAPAKTQSEVACERAQANLAVLNSPQQVKFDRDGDGETEVMTDEERAANREAAQRQVTAYCEPVAAGE
ncbi:hypothetical protein [Arenimonas donghaensis]|uniref:DUF4124 domain-containing protein n=1 Tax=Arenimonas donghaensis DSM 18148 = HO3-R19 TaxID=1121014 RepID=A0A087MFR4_9GAMM|nr:hypothetical protein [Arenimonas donghaensis]KFL35717.1 hypothetical protein N788_07320 [Arenimonas donghaensis DSM 18148 = HO3-R19]